MTDGTNPEERAERIRQLQARRASSAGTKKRRHPAAATRWLLGGLSIASFFTIAGSVAVANQSTVANTPAARAPAVASTPSSSTRQAGTATPSSASSSPRSVPAPHTTTRGS